MSHCVSERKGLLFPNNKPLEGLCQKISTRAATNHYFSNMFIILMINWIEKFEHFII